jgi:MtN3 and saliva related transmembrane protein
MEWQTVIGLAAGFCTTVAFVPQVLKTCRSRSAGDLSLSTCLVFVVGLALWLVYGLVRGDLAMTAANAVTLPLAGAILYFKVRYG